MTDSLGSAAARVEIVAPGALATVQDLGRRGWRRYGMPTAGVLDPFLLAIANRLAGNDEGAAAIEFFVAGPTLRALDAPVRVAAAGDFPLLLERDGQRSTHEPWRSLTLQPGDTLRAGAPRTGRVGYLALQGLAVPPVMGSASTYTRAMLGGHAGRALAAGDRLAVEARAAAAGDAPERLLRAPPPIETGPIRVVLGPQHDHFEADQIAAFLAGEYTVSREADRMGVRLDGPRLVHRADKGAEIVSDAAIPGSIQVPGNGLPIVLLADGQTVGGYPKIATVCSADRPRLATAAVGARLRFAAVTVAEAEALARHRRAALDGLLGTIVELRLADGIDLDAIHGANLISGVVDALHPTDEGA